MANKMEISVSVDNSGGSAAKPLNATNTPRLPSCSPLNSPLLLFIFAADDSDPGITAFILTALSVLLIIVTMPFSLCLCIKVIRIACSRGHGIYVEADPSTYCHDGKTKSVTSFNLWRSHEGQC